MTFMWAWDGTYFWAFIKLYEETKKKVESNLNHTEFGSSYIKITMFQKIAHAWAVWSPEHSC